MNIYAILNSIHRTLGRSKLATRFAIYLRNQCRCVIFYHLIETPEHDENGESFLIQKLGDNVNTFIDVGANVGDWAELVLKNSPHIKSALLFEPADSAFTELYDRFQNTANIKIIKQPVSDQPGEMSFFEEPDAGKTSSLVKGYSNASALEKKFMATTIDDEAKKHELQIINLLKIDAEGYDFYVLRGSTALLSDQRIEVIQFEYNDSWVLSGCTLYAAMKFLESFGYQVFLLKSNGLYKLNYELYGEFFHYANFVAISSKKFPELQHLVVGSI